MREASRERSGIVLVNGPAGSGRTTSLAAMLAEINRERACHVVTIEDPIEFLHRHETATINQREVGVDTPSLAHGIAAAMRQGAQVVLASEARGPEEARLLLEAAETGHLVMTTVRGLDTASALLRLLSFFPVEERGEVRERLARVLRWSFAQYLLPHAGGRKAVVEVWRGTRRAATHLAAGSLDSVAMADELREGEADGQIGFDRALEERVRCGEMSVETALAHALQPCALETRLSEVGEGRR
jgi:twitching motility protein PilT